MNCHLETELSNLEWFIALVDALVWKETVPLHLWVWIHKVFDAVFIKANRVVSIHK